jgi:hypothetical protein
LRRLRRWWSSIGVTNQIGIVIPLMVAVIGAIVVIRSGGSDASDVPPVPSKAGAKVVVDGLTVEASEKGGEVVDLQVRNAGDRVSYVHAVRFEVSAMREVPFCPLPSAMPSSYSYDIAFPDVGDSLPVVVEDRIDQAIEGDDVDRFRLELGNPKGGLGSMLYRAEMELVYNDDETTDPEPLVVNLDGFMEAAAYTTIGDDPAYVRCLKELTRNVIAITGLPGERSDALHELRRDAFRLARELKKEAPPG